MRACFTLLGIIGAWEDTDQTPKKEFQSRLVDGSKTGQNIFFMYNLAPARAIDAWLLQGRLEVGCLDEGADLISQKLGMHPKFAKNFQCTH